MTTSSPRCSIRLRRLPATDSRVEPARTSVRTAMMRRPSSGSTNTARVVEGSSAEPLGVRCSDCRQSPGTASVARPRPTSVDAASGAVPRCQSPTPIAPLTTRIAITAAASSVPDRRRVAPTGSEGPGSAPGAIVSSSAPPVRWPSRTTSSRSTATTRPATACPAMTPIAADTSSGRSPSTNTASTESSMTSSPSAFGEERGARSAPGRMSPERSITQPSGPRPTICTSHHAGRGWPGSAGGRGRCVVSTTAHRRTVRSA